MSKLDTADIQIHFTKRSTAYREPVLLLYGWRDDASRLDDPIAWLSGEWYPLIVPTFNGFGESLFQLTGSFERNLVQNVGHFPQREDPEAIAREELTVFLGGVP